VDDDDDKDKACTHTHGVPDPVLSALLVVSHIILTISPLLRCHFHLHLTEDEMNGWGG